MTIIENREQAKRAKRKLKHLELVNEQKRIQRLIDADLNR